MIVAVPVAIPVTIPVAEPTVAIPVELLLQVPPLTISVKAIVEPIHTWLSPEIGPGEEFTVIVLQVAQPVDEIV